MMHSTENRAAIGRILALGLLLATLLAMPLATVPADAAVTSGKAFSWSINDARAPGTLPSSICSSSSWAMGYLPTAYEARGSASNSRCISSMRL